MERKPITAADIPQRPELIMGLAAILIIVGVFGAWISIPGYTYTDPWTGRTVTTGGASASGWDAVGGKVTLVAGLIMLYSAAVCLGYIRILKDVVPVLSISAVCGLLALVTALAVWSGLSAPAGAGWGLYLTIVAGLVALFAAYRALVLERGRV